MAHTMWTSNTDYYRDTLDKLTEARKAWQAKTTEFQRVLTVAATRATARAPVPSNWCEMLCEGVENFKWKTIDGYKPELKEKVIDYFFSFSALWKVRIRAFVDTIGTCCLHDMISTFYDSVKARFADLGEVKLMAAFDVFERLEQKRESLVERLKVLKEAHRILLDGDLPYLPPSSTRAKVALK